MKVKLRELLVTATTTGGDTAWVMVDPVDFHGTGYSGLELDLSHLSSAPAVGDRLLARGTVRSPGREVLEVDSVEVTSTGETPTPVNVTSEEFAAPANAAALNGLLVRVNSLSLTSNAVTSWLMTGEPSGALTVGNRLIGPCPPIRAARSG